MGEKKVYDIATFINGVYTIVGEAQTEYNVDGKGTDGVGGSIHMDLPARQIFFLVEKKDEGINGRMPTYF